MYQTMNYDFKINWKQTVKSLQHADGMSVIITSDMSKSDLENENIIFVM